MALLWKMTYKDKVSYTSSTLSINSNTRCNMDVLYMSMIYGFFVENDL